MKVSAKDKKTDSLRPDLVLFLVSIGLLITSLAVSFILHHGKTVITIKGGTPIVLSEVKAKDFEVDRNRPINVNRADVEELILLKGIGEDKAQKIIEYRKSKGPFKKPKDLMKVKGIGPKIVEDNRERILIE